MRIMMEENQIHHDIISKLWQIYSAYYFTEMKENSNYIFFRQGEAPSETTATWCYHNSRNAGLGQEERLD